MLRVTRNVCNGLSFMALFASVSFILIFVRRISAVQDQINTAKECKRPYSLPLQEHSPSKPSIWTFWVDKAEDCAPVGFNSGQRCKGK